MILYLAGYKYCAKRWNLDTKDIYLLSSFWEHKSGHYGSYVCQEKHILDSGAFSAFSGKNDSFDWDGYVKKYADFVLKNNIQRFFELDIDVVVGLEKVEYYRRYLENVLEKSEQMEAVLQLISALYHIILKKVI
mgnify:CR=1 FL=1